MLSPAAGGISLASEKVVFGGFVRNIAVADVVLLLIMTGAFFRQTALTKAVADVTRGRVKQADFALLISVSGWCGNVMSDSPWGKIVMLARA